MSFIVDYFSLDRDEFVRRYFAGRKEVLEMATTEAAHRRILTDLRNPEQQAIVAAPLDGNHLVLAGPGSGKTRVIVHRVAWLLRECMVLPEEVMVLAYNRSAAVEVKRRLWELIGPDAAGVSVQTLHGLALRLTGTSYAVAAERGEAIQFDSVIKAATQMLKQAEQGDDVGPSVQRDRLLAGLRHLLVDEYQDVNADHFALISAVAGRTLNSEEDRLSLLVVGDDDQNVYAFGGANVRFIRQFEIGDQENGSEIAFSPASDSCYWTIAFPCKPNFGNTDLIAGSQVQITEREEQIFLIQQGILGCPTNVAQTQSLQGRLEFDPIKFPISQEDGLAVLRQDRL